MNASRPIRLSEELYDQVVSAAIFEATDDNTIIARAIGFYIEHLRIIREGMDGPLYRQEIERGSLPLQAVLGPKINTWRIDIPGENPEIDRG